MDWNPLQEDTFDFIDYQHQNYSSEDHQDPFQLPQHHQLNLSPYASEQTQIQLMRKQKIYLENILDSLNPVLTKEQLKQHLFTKLTYMYQNSQMDRFNSQFWNYSPWSVCVLVSQYCWEISSNIKLDSITPKMIEDALLSIIPRKINSLIPSSKRNM